MPPHTPSLLPPIPLYRRLLRAHRRHLPPSHRRLGDHYLKSEFRAHRGVTNPAQLVGFLSEWQVYAEKLEGGMWKGERMEGGKVERLSDQQVGQLYELKQAIQAKEGSDGGGVSP